MRGLAWAWVGSAAVVTGLALSLLPSEWAVFEPPHLAPGHQLLVSLQNWKENKEEELCGGEETVASEMVRQPQ